MCCDAVLECVCACMLVYMSLHGCKNVGCVVMKDVGVCIHAHVVMCLRGRKGCVVEKCVSACTRVCVHACVGVPRATRCTRCANTVALVGNTQRPARSARRDDHLEQQQTNNDRAPE